MVQEKKIVQVWRVALLLVCGSLIGWILWQYFGVSGIFQFTYQFNDRPSYISRLGPVGRALDREQNTANGEYYQRIVADPAYFSVQLPSPYPVIDVTLEYQNPTQNIVQLGVRLTDDNETVFGYAFQPLENKFVDDSKWDRVANEQYILLQRTHTYDRVEDFLNAPPADARVGTFLTNLELPLIDPDYQPTDRTIDITTPLRGRHELMTYIKNETLDFTITFEDINYAVDDDTFTIDVERLGQIISTQTLPDDGETGITGRSQGPRTAYVKLENVSAGVYTIILNAHDDILFTHIESPQDRLVFNKAIHLAGTPEYANTIPTITTAATTLYSNSSLVNILAKHYYGVQDLEFYDTTLSIDRVDIPFVWRNPVWNYFYSVTVPQNDVYLTNDTSFALDREQWFDPWFGFRALTQDTDSSRIDYIISGQYTAPTRVRSWTTATAKFDLSKVDRSDPTAVDFIVSAPGLERAAGGMKIRRISIEASKEPITLSNLWDRLAKKFF